MMRGLAWTMLFVGACVTPVSTHPLLGRDLDDVRLRHGPPVACSVAGGASTLAYRDASGEVAEDALAIVDDRVVGEGQAAGAATSLAAVPISGRWAVVQALSALAALHRH